MKPGNTIYANKDNNICYKDDEIFETSIECNNAHDAIVSLFCRIFCTNIIETIILTTMYSTNTDWTIVSLCSYLAEHHNKSSRTFRRSINNMIDKGVIIYNKGQISICPDCDISPYDLDNVKSIIIHINKTK